MPQNQIRSILNGNVAFLLDDLAHFHNIAPRLGKTSSAKIQDQ